MKRSEIKILIVEDDPTQGKALLEALKRKGYDARLVYKADEALSSFKISDYKGIIIDCMIPKTNGVDLAIKLRTDGGDKLKILLISGIYTDRQFVRNALLKTKAEDFLTKPLDLEELVKKVDGFFDDILDVDTEKLFRPLMTAKVNRNDVIEGLEEIESVHGFDVPYIYSLLRHVDLTGRLDITYENGEKFQVYYDNGEVVNIVSEDKESYFGVLLVEKGFTSFEELETGLKQGGDKPIGERLVDINSLSPHAINLIYKEQMGIRMSKSIRNTSVQLDFSEEKVDRDPQAATINDYSFRPMLSDWIFSKLSLDWIKLFYTPWLDNKLQVAEEFKNLELTKNLPLLQKTPRFISDFQPGLTLQEILSRETDSEDNIFRSLHYLVLDRVVRFDEKVSVRPVDFRGKITRLKRIKKNMKDKTHFEVMGLSMYARPSEISRAYLDMAKGLHPDKLPPNAPDELVELSKQIFTRVASAYEILKDEQKRLKYRKSLELGEAEEVIQVETKFERALNDLHNGRYQAAFVSLRAIANRKQQFRKDIFIYLLWAQLKSAKAKAASGNFIQSIEETMEMIPPEERHNAPYFYIKGLYHKIIGDYKKAATYFRHAISVDRDFVPAKREYLSLRNKKRNQKSLVNEISNIFVKKAK